MRRHWLLVSLIVVACVDLALAYGALKEDEYRATATVSAPRPAGSALQSDAQYLDSQVLLLNSRQVGDRALEIARATPAGAGIDRAELAPTIGKVEIIPPPSGSSGSYGTTIVSILFSAPSADEAQVGVNALATAYDEVRSQEIADRCRGAAHGHRAGDRHGGLPERGVSPARGARAGTHRPGSGRLAGGVDLHGREARGTGELRPAQSPRRRTLPRRRGWAERPRSSGRAASSTSARPRSPSGCTAPRSCTSVNRQTGHRARSSSRSRTGSWGGPSPIA